MIIWVDSIFAEKVFSQSPLIVRQIMCIKEKLYFLGTNLGRVYSVLVSSYLYLFPVLLSKKLAILFIDLIIALVQHF